MYFNPGEWFFRSTTHILHSEFQFINMHIKCNLRENKRCHLKMGNQTRNMIPD